MFMSAAIVCDERCDGRTLRPILQLLVYPLRDQSQECWSNMLDQHHDQHVGPTTAPFPSSKNRYLALFAGLTGAAAG